jgi:hypothetical protein
MAGQIRQGRGGLWCRSVTKRPVTRLYKSFWCSSLESSTSSANMFFTGSSVTKFKLGQVRVIVETVVHGSHPGLPTCVTSPHYLTPGLIWLSVYSSKYMVLRPSTSSLMSVLTNSCTLIIEPINWYTRSKLIAGLSLLSRAHDGIQWEHAWDCPLF